VRSTDRKNEPRMPPSSHLTRPVVNPSAGPVGARLPGGRNPKMPFLHASPTAPPPVPRRHAVRSSPARSSRGGPVARRSPSRMRRARSIPPGGPRAGRGVNPSDAPTLTLRCRPAASPASSCTPRA
jgi:hypothetical protein